MSININPDIAILGSFKAFGVLPTGDKGKDMQTFLNTVNESRQNNSITGDQSQSIAALLNALDIATSGNPDADLAKMAGALSNPWNAANGSANKNNNVDTAILGSFKAFGIQPTGDKGKDMQTFLNKVNESRQNNSITADQSQSLGKLQGALGIEPSGNPDADLAKMADALSHPEQRSNSSSNNFVRATVEKNLGIEQSENSNVSLAKKATALYNSGNASNGASNNKAQTDTAILGAFQAFGVQPSGDKTKDMYTFLKKVNESRQNGSINDLQSQRLDALQGALGIEKSGNPDADLAKMAGALLNPGNASNGASNNKAQTDKAILGAFQSFGVRPTGDKTKDMYTFLKKVNESRQNNSITDLQSQRLGALQGALGIEQSGDPDLDLAKMADALLNPDEEFNAYA